MKEFPSTWKNRRRLRCVSPSRWTVPFFGSRTAYLRHFFSFPFCFSPLVHIHSNASPLSSGYLLNFNTAPFLSCFICLSPLLLLLLLLLVLLFSVLFCSVSVRFFSFPFLSLFFFFFFYVLLPFSIEQHTPRRYQRLDFVVVCAGSSGCDPLARRLPPRLPQQRV